MNNNVKSLIKILHVLSACLWLGASTSVVLLQFLKGWSSDGRELAYLNMDFAFLDVLLIIPGAMGSLVTGFWICKTTSWGFLRYRWVMVKWIGTLSGILVGASLLGPWQLKMVDLSNRIQSEFSTNSPYGLTRSLFTLIGLLQVILLVMILAVSVRKPWGKRIAVQPKRRLVGRGDEEIAGG